MTFLVMGRERDKVTKKVVPWDLSLETLSEGLGFRGRPTLVQRILPAFKELWCRNTRANAYSAKVILHYFWRFLDYYEELSRALPGIAPATIHDLDWDELEAIWRHWIDWLRQRPAAELSQRTRYLAAWRTHAVFRRAYELERQAGKTTKPYLRIYVYFRSKRSSAYGGDPLSYEEATRAFNALGRIWRAILGRIERARALADAGANPMVGSGNAQRRGDTDVGWSPIRNRLWIVRDRLPLGGLVRGDASVAQLREGLSVPLPADLIIPELGQHDSGLKAYTSCLFLRKEELAVAFAMVTMKTGMNPDSISRMAADSWYHDDPFDPERQVVIYGPKRDGRTNLRAQSTKRKWTDPFLIIKQVLEIQQPLRDRLAELARERSDRRLEMQSKLIWIGAGGHKGVFDLLPKGGAYDALHGELDKIFDRMGVKRLDGSPIRYRVTEGRDVWGLFVYHRSGFNQILTARALGQSTITALLHYLEKRVQIVQDRIAFVDLQGRVFDGLLEGRYSPRELRLGPADQAVTGLFCTNALKPTADADPGNRGDEPCRAQGCWACCNWLATIESLVHLARMEMDLQELAATMPLALWHTSDYPIMLAVYQHIIGKFHHSHVEKARGQASKVAPIILTAMFSAARSVRAISP